MPSKVRLTVDSYDQVVRDDDGNIKDINAYERGAVFTPLNDAEYERLLDIGAAEDPKRQAEVQKEEAERRVQDAERRLEEARQTESSGSQSSEDAEKEIEARREALASEAEAPKSRKPGK